ncbi:MAG: TonB-dependent receptor domain-containing protein [Methylophilus sp.]|uniref:TonB-dependent receptor domain-containing protein n=1 Tax=Methylophilus sp. TaxID=29541 RepID=UPI003F9EC2F4
MPSSILFRSLLLSCFSLLFVDKASYAEDFPNAAVTTVEQSQEPNPPIQKKPVNKADAEVDTLPEVNVKDSRIIETPFNPTQSISSVTAEELARNQPSSIFDAVRAIPGVSISGGPRPSGMTFSIRGYADNEDVMIKVDGVPKGFEKYRMGGTFIEPELLKSIEVQRGPQITSGSGSLGGTIIASTKNAEDFLKPGQKYGAKVKFGYGNNNDEYSRSYMLYGRPDERVDILYNYSNRHSNNITLGDGTKLDDSAIESISHLLKLSLFPTESIQLVTSIVKFEDSGLQPYDATGGQPGFFGNVIRSIDDLTWSESFSYNPGNRWVNLKAAVGAGHTNLEDLMRPGMSSFNSLQPLCDGLVYRPNPANTSICRGNLTDTYQYKTKTIDVSNRTLIFEKDAFSASLLAGYQYNSSEREIERFFDNRNSVIQTTQYPNGFNASAPPGSKAFDAIYLQPRFEIGKLSITPGYRKDNYEVQADGGTLALLKPFNQKNKIKFKEETWSLGLAYDFFDKNNPEKLTLYTNYGQGFRPPLIDEYFTQGNFSLCTAGAMPNGPASQICGDLYQPQLSESTEAGISYQNPHLLNTDVWFSGKLNFYHIYTSHLLLSLRQEADGRITQNGWERRNGVEVESMVQYQGMYMRGAYSRINGELFNGVAQIPLFTVPGNALNINIGKEFSKNVDFNLTYRKVSNRDVLIGGTAAFNPQFGEQEGYELWNAGIRWKANEQLTLRLIGENLKNEQYRIDGTMGGLGILGPGRNVKFFVELMY